MNHKTVKPGARVTAQLRFQTLIARLSSEFINLPPEQINAHINQALGQVAEFFGFNLAAVSKFTGHGSEGMVTHIWTAPEVPSIPPGFTEQDFPWKAKLIAQGHDARAPSLDVLPAEAATDRATYERFGIQSVYDWCLRPGGAVLGCLSLVAVGKPHPFPQGFEEGLQMFAQILASALERERADQILQESEVRLALAADAAEAGLWRLDLADGQLWMTHRNRILLGFEAQGEITREQFLARVHPDDRQRVGEIIDQVSDTGMHGCVEYRVVLPDGSIRWLSSCGRLQSVGCRSRCLMGVTTDVTARKRAEAELRQSYLEIQQLKERLQAERDYLKAEVKITQAQGEVIGKSAGIRQVLGQAELVAATDSTVLIRGETGTGKELIAQAIHRLSQRRGHVMIKVNCAALPSALVESELFGREKGAFTGALTRQVGRFELADHSTIFLDEVGELSFEVQAKLLRVLQEGQFERLGSPRTLKVNVRVIAATNRDLASDVKAGRFREDLFYRLNVFPIRVPPLRERAEDIPLLVWSFLEEFSSRMGKKITQIPRSTMEKLQRNLWPGNVRELRNVIEHGTIVTTGNTLLVPLLQEETPTQAPPQTMTDAERRHILRILERTGWRIKGPQGAAGALGLNPSTLYSRMERLGIPTRRRRDSTGPR